MNRDEKRKLLDDQIAEARGGDPADFNLWRQKSEVVLRNVVGDANPLYAAFTKIRYSLGVYTDRTPQSAFDDARRRGVQKAIAVLEAAKTEVELGGGSPQPRQDSAVGTKVFVVHGRNEAQKHEVARVCCAFG